MWKIKQSGMKMITKKRQKTIRRVLVDTYLTLKMKVFEDSEDRY